MREGKNNLNTVMKTDNVTLGYELVTRVVDLSGLSFSRKANGLKINGDGRTLYYMITYNNKYKIKWLFNFELQIQLTH